VFLHAQAAECVVVGVATVSVPQRVCGRLRARQNSAGSPFARYAAAGERRAPLR
jgi:hypothetical protein